MIETKAIVNSKQRNTNIKYAKKNPKLKTPRLFSGSYFIIFKSSWNFCKKKTIMIMFEFFLIKQTVK